MPESYYDIDRQLMLRELKQATARLFCIVLKETATEDSIGIYYFDRNKYVRFTGDVSLPKTVVANAGAARYVYNPLTKALKPCSDEHPDILLLQ